MVHRSPENEKELDVKLEWVPVQAPDGKPYFYPDDHKRLRQVWSSTVVYRWALSRQGSKPQFVVGETEDLYKRVQAYVRSTPKNLVEIRKHFDRVHASGGTVGLEVLRFEDFAINRVVFDEHRLRSFFVRRVLENICSEILVQQGFELLNDTSQKRAIRKAARLSGLPAEQLERVVQEVTSRRATSTSSH